MQSAPGYRHGRFERNTQHSAYHWKRQARKATVGGGAEKPVQGDQVPCHMPGDSRERFLMPGDSRERFLMPGDSRERFLKVL